MLGSDFTSKGLVLSERAYVGGASPPATFEDESRFGNDGVHTNITWEKLPSGLWVRSFDGTSYVDLGSSNSLRLIILTIEAWIKPDAIDTGYNDLVSNQTGGISGFWFSQVNQAVGFLYVGTSAMSVSGNVVVAGVWQKIGVTFNGSTQVYLYKNGVEVLSQGVTGTPVIATANLFIGRYATSVVQLFEGLMVMVKMRRYVQSEEEIANRFQAERHWFGV